MKKIKLSDDILNIISQNETVIKTKTTSGNDIKDAKDPKVYFDIKEDDSIFTVIVKEYINEHKINIQALNFKDTCEMNNYKQSLDKHKTMSVNKFARWMELLGIEWQVIYGKDYELYQRWKKEQRQALLKRKNNGGE